MSDAILNENELTENEPLTPEELLSNFTRDLVLNNPPADLVTEFIEDFVLVDRPETAQFTALFEMPAENLVELMRGLITQGFQTQIQALDSHGFAFIESVKAELKKQMTILAAESE